MKVLMVSWAWYPSGGDWTYLDNVKQLYEQKGYEVIPFSRQNERNVETIYTNNFVATEDFKVLNGKKNLINGLKVVKDSIVSLPALNKLEEILAAHDFEFAHLHNIHHYITPAIIWKLKKKGIKILWTLHDYKIICPENSFVSNGVVCEKCMTGNFYHCATNKCKKESFAASSLAALDAYFYHQTKTYEKVDAFLCPSQFLLEKFKAFGFPNEKLFLTNYCYNIDLIDNYISDHPLDDSVDADSKDRYVLYVGRVEKIKGVKTLIDAVNGTGIKLKIAGSGNELDALIEYVNGLKIDNIEFLGFQRKDAVFSLTKNAAFVVCPSEWYENFPFSVTESFLFAKAVIGSNMGGIPELVIDGKTGLLFEAGDVLALRQKIQLLWNDEELTKELGTNARKHAVEIFNASNHWNKLTTVLNKLNINDQ
ncbi:MAG: glycosyltransferase family 1 protein [Pedobacter sp.]|nr:MAG: glycosyltransferase family 1 protein [Pedobacter sp.]